MKRNVFLFVSTTCQAKRMLPFIFIRLPVGHPYLLPLTPRCRRGADCGLIVYRRSENNNDDRYPPQNFSTVIFFIA